MTCVLHRGRSRSQVTTEGWNGEFVRSNHSPKRIRRFQPAWNDATDPGLPSTALGCVAWISAADALHSFFSALWWLGTWLVDKPWCPVLCTEGDVALAQSPLRATLHLSPVTSQQAVGGSMWVPALEKQLALSVPTSSNILRAELIALNTLNDLNYVLKYSVRFQAQCFFFFF
jgi:hypothetical protein